MAKKFKKHYVRPRKDNVGCMWGLISMFDFRRERFTQRLLSDKQRGIVRNLGVGHSRRKIDLPSLKQDKHRDADIASILSDAQSEDADIVDLSKIKTLIEKEISRAHTLRKESSSRIELIKAEFGVRDNNDKKYRDGRKEGVGPEIHANDLTATLSSISLQTDYPNVAGILSSDLDSCSNGFHCEANQIERKSKIDQFPCPENICSSVSILEKATTDLIETFLSCKSVDSNNLPRNTEVQQSKEFTHALEMLKSNKELFLKLLQGPNSPIHKYMQELQNVHFGKLSEVDQNQLLGELPGSRELQKRSRHYFFKKRDKLRVVHESNEGEVAQVPNRIVFLKPSPVRNQNSLNTIGPSSSIQSPCGLKNKEVSERFSSHFSLKEIKRRFINAIGAGRNERNPIAMDGILHKIPYGRQCSKERDTSLKSKPVEIVRDKISKNIYQNKNELAMASKVTGDHKKLSTNVNPRFFYREAAFYDEARKHLDELIQTENEIELLPIIHSSRTLGRILSFPVSNYLSPRISPAMEKEADNLHEEIVSVNKDLLSPSRIKGSSSNDEESRDAKDGGLEIIEIEETGQLAQLKFNSPEDKLPTEINKEEATSMLLESEQSEERSEPLTPIPMILASAPLVEVKENECIVDNTGRPSPISVLEHLFCENVSSPGDIITGHATNSEKLTNPRELQFDDSAVASCSTDPEADLMTFMNFDEASLFDELEISYSLLIDDPKLLFDSIDEVLTEIKEKHFSCTPWVSFIRPKVCPQHKQEDFIEEACKKINWHLHMQFPRTLEQAIRRDLDGRIWIDLHLEAEKTVFEVGDAVLDCLFEETALELWD